MNREKSEDVMLESTKEHTHGSGCSVPMFWARCDTSWLTRRTQLSQTLLGSRRLLKIIYGELTIDWFLTSNIMEFHNPDKNKKFVEFDFRGSILCKNAMIPQKNSPQEIITAYKNGSG